MKVVRKIFEEMNEKKNPIDRFLLLKVIKSVLKLRDLVFEKWKFGKHVKIVEINS